MAEVKTTKPNPRGRPPLSNEQVEGKRARIAEAARQLFEAEGYEAVSLRRIAKEVGCTPMSIYTYYEGKIDVLRALWDDVFIDVFAKIVAAKTSNQDPTDAIKAMCVAYVQYWLDNRASYRLVFMSAGVEQSDVSVFVEASPVADRYGVFLVALAAATDRPTTDIVGDAQTLICGLNGIAHSLITISSYDWASPIKLVTNLVQGVLLCAKGRQ
ncbi:MAG: TetR/AcrR family transcriptional regulator [Aquidulcibacter sp.]|jgi:AcrR family transcriptional regulator|uniref:TetR/AcrR family transcriptional regulator n=1 Tax=Aquidulcibacter sp. TaxID=2052990 RepID=UPI0022C014A8|nr:TetR/AcrR family transcriptional regulator [Aquidulcibacter sp.]